jgi:hypothetical protein
MPADITTIKRWNSELDTRFSAFHSTRKRYHDAVHRELPPITDAMYAARIAEYQSPLLEKAWLDWTDMLASNPVKFDSVPGKSGKNAIDDANNHRLWHARQWNVMNPEGRWDTWVAAGQALDGVAVTRLLYHGQEEPDVSSLEDRDEWMENRANVFYLDQCDIQSVRWMERGNEVQVVIQEIELPVLSKEIAYDGAKLGLEKGKRYVPIHDATRASGIGWVGDGEAVDDNENQTTKTVRVLVCEYRDFDKTCPICIDNHPLWVGAEIVCAPGKELQDGDVVKTYTLPWKHEPSFRITPGRTGNERDPDRKYRPPIYPLLVEAQILNWATSVYQTITSRDAADSRVYGKLNSQLEGVQFPEGWGEKWTMPIPNADSGEIFVAPFELMAWPNEMAESLVNYIQMAERRFLSAMPNEFLMGENDEAVKEGTAASNVSATQQARIPVSRMLQFSDATRLRIHEDIDHAIQFWDQEAGKGEEVKYYNMVMGDENLIKGGGEAGQKVYLSASRLESHPQLVLKTDAETLVEQMQREARAFQMHAAGQIDDEQLLEHLGFTDTESQMRRIAKQKARRAADPIRTTLLNNTITQLVSLVGEVNPMLLMPGGGMGMPPAPGGGGAPQAPVAQRTPSVALPPIERPAGGAGVPQGAGV